MFTTWHAQHHATVDAAAKALAGKRIKSLEILWHEDVHKWHPGQQWIWEPGGFGVFDPGINAFSIATKIFPGGLFVQSAELQRAGQCPDADCGRHCLLEPSSGRTASRQPRLATKRGGGVDDHGRDEPTVKTFGWKTAGPRLILNGGSPRKDDGIGEYPDIYRTFVDLIDERRSLVDVAPFRLVADCFLIGKRNGTDPVHS